MDAVPEKLNLRFELALVKVIVLLASDIECSKERVARFHLLLELTDNDLALWQLLDPCVDD